MAQLSETHSLSPAVATNSIDELSELWRELDVSDPLKEKLLEAKIAN